MRRWTQNVEIGAYLNAGTHVDAGWGYQRTGQVLVLHAICSNTNENHYFYIETNFFELQWLNILECWEDEGVCGIRWRWFKGALVWVRSCVG